MDPIRVIIVDDEGLARDILKEHCRAHPEASIVAECSNGFDAVKAISDLKPDVVFLDVQMPKLNGFEVLELVDATFEVVFVTAHDEHALKAFDANAVDYLLKPFSAERFERAWQKATTAAARSDLPKLKKVASSLARGSGHSDRILIRDGANVTVVPVSSVDYVEATDDYVAIAAGGKKHLKQQTLASLESQLDPHRFVRVHRSFIVNIDRLAKIERYAKDSRILILRDGTRIPLSRSGHDRVKSLLA